MTSERKPKLTRGEILIALFCLALLLAALVILGIDVVDKIERERACEAAGGVLMRTTFGEVCTEEGLGNGKRR